MLFDMSEWNVRAADLDDLEALEQLIQRKSFVHRHLGWGTPLDWLGTQPFLILEDDDDLLAALACPPDEDGITWLQLFAAVPGISLSRSWEILWSKTKSILENSSSVTTINSLVIKNELGGLLTKAGFSLHDQVVVLVWEASRAIWPKLNSEYSVREMELVDLNGVYQVDRSAFKEIWRNSISQLEKAYQEAFSATVIEIDNKIRGYQISTVNPEGGHLARLAIDSAYQSKGLGTLLLAEVLDKFMDQGIVEVSVNTQVMNRASLDLYIKFGFQLLEERYPVRQLLIR